MLLTIDSQVFNCRLNCLSFVKFSSVPVVIDFDVYLRMSYNDFVTNYHKIEICNLGPDSPQDESGVKKHWEATVHEGSWVSRVNAGGCRNFLGETKLQQSSSNIINIPWEF